MGFHNSQNRPVRAPDHPAEILWFLGFKAQQGAFRPGFAVLLEQGLKGGGADQRHVSAKDQDLPLKILEGGLGLLNRVAGPQLLGLFDKLHGTVGAGLLDLRRLIPHHHEDACGIQGRHRVQHMDQ